MHLIGPHRRWQQARLEDVALSLWRGAFAGSSLLYSGHENESCSCLGPERWPPGSNAFEEHHMAKSQRKGSKEIRKPKKDAPPKQNASNPSLKGGQQPSKG
jgi:hypothetical protein